MFDFHDGQIIFQLPFVFKVEDLKDHAEIVDVPLAGELQTAYKNIENSIRPCLVQLQETGCVASSYTASNITGDYTRFVLKQEKKKKSDLFNTDQNCDGKKHKMLIYLHVLVTTAELIRECGITVAQGIRICFNTFFFLENCQARPETHGMHIL